MAAGGAAPLIAAESPGPVALFIRAVAPEVVAESAQPTAASGDPPRKGGRRVTSRSPSGAAHPGNGLIAPFHDGRLRSRGVKGTRRPPFSAPPARRRPSETAIRTASPALTSEPSRPGGANWGGSGPGPTPRWKVIRRAHGGALLFGSFMCGWAMVVRPSFSRARGASRRPGRGGAGVSRSAGSSGNRRARHSTRENVC